jgi:hypothetical protein
VIDHFIALVQRCTYPGLWIRVRVEGCPPCNLKGLYLQVECPNGTCTRTGQPAPWKGRKWRLSEHMTDGEVVATAFKAIITALEHEARELFKFDGQPVFDSHIDIHKLVALHRDQNSTVERSPL